MSKAIGALYTLVGHIANKNDVSELLTQSHLFRHALATPLTNLLINLELAQEHHVENPYLSAALHNARRLKELLNLSQESLPSSAQSFRVKPAIAETLLFLGRNRVSLQSHITLSAHCCLQGSKLLFQEALLCALKNAQESYQSDARLKTVVVQATETPSMITIAITDGGCGLNTWQKAMVFADGFSLKPGNSGVGLSWIKRVVVRHFHGKLELLSKPGRGTTLIWHLPKPTPIENQSHE